MKLVNTVKTPNPQISVKEPHTGFTITYEQWGMQCDANVWMYDKDINDEAMAQMYEVVKAKAHEYFNMKSIGIVSPY